MRWLTRGQLLRRLDIPRIEAALAAAELQTSGEIRVSVAPLFWGSVAHAADLAFARLGMTGTRERNGVLLFVVPSRRKFVILGDEGIHQKVTQVFWDRTAAAMSKHFHDEDFTGGLVAAIEEVGRQLSAHFPRRHDDVNELPDTVDLGESPKPGR